ncbi:DUF1269 domain-containing protein [Pseudonocardia sp.]|uniref:DUF1269 domain-containing protein n=1 Tax=Pseudonocardia sp. TaxID=60912 RepID=UPI00262F20D5|nr:DUF1269 domain-containing protein [Pseudonocardia sp.]
MSTLSVWRFDTESGAEDAVATLQELARKRLVTVWDAATVSWPQDAKKPRTRQLHDLAGRGALGGAFWGLLFGLLFFVPLLGAAIGAAFGALSGSLADVGISDDFVKRARDEITPGTSALFVLTSDVVLDKVTEAFAGQKPELLFTNLSSDQDEALRVAFAE